MPTRLAIFASGAGSNAREIIRHFAGRDDVLVSLVVSNKPEAGVLQIAQANNINTLIINKKQLNEPGFPESAMAGYGIDFIILAGFLLKIPDHLVRAFPGKIINIHPALLPKYGGKGMYGMHVHEAVIAAGEKESGITIHFVDNQYDHGETIFQATCPVNPNDSPESLAGKIHALEHEYYPAVIDRLLQNRR